MGPGRPASQTCVPCAHGGLPARPPPGIAACPQPSSGTIVSRAQSGAPPPPRGLLELKPPVHILPVRMKPGPCRPWPQGPLLSERKSPLSLRMLLPLFSGVLGKTPASAPAAASVWAELQGTEFERTPSGLLPSPHAAVVGKPPGPLLASSPPPPLVETNSS